MRKGRGLPMTTGTENDPRDLVQCDITECNPDEFDVQLFSIYEVRDLGAEWFIYKNWHSGSYYEFEANPDGTNSMVFRYYPYGMKYDLRTLSLHQCREAARRDYMVIKWRRR